jgi:hypothetical protein
MKTWYNPQLRQRLETIIDQQFRGARIFKTSALLGFYCSQIKGTSRGNRFGLDTIFSESIRELGSKEQTPQFVMEFVKYCSSED